MPRVLPRDSGLRRVTHGATLCLSLLASQSLALADDFGGADGVAQASGRQTSQRELESDDRTQYPGLTFVKPGSSSASVRKQAIANLGLQRLPAEAQWKAQSVLKNLGMYRRLPTISFEVDPDIYHYFLNNPDVAVSTWRAMEISQFQLQQTGTNQYRADAGDGSVGDVELFLHTPNEILIHCDGAFKSPLLPKPIVARALMRLEMSFAREQDGRIIGTHSGDVFVEFPSSAIEAVAKVISPVSHAIADRNFKQMTLFVHLMSQAMAKHPGWIEQTGKKLEGISAEKKAEFLEVTARSYVDSRRRLNPGTFGITFVPDEVLSPFRQINSQGTAQSSTQRAQGTIRPVQATRPASSTARD